MQIPKQQVIDFIKSKMGSDSDNAQQADKELPEQVDTDKDSGLLQKFGVDPQELMGGGGDSGGGLGSKLGL